MSPKIKIVCTIAVLAALVIIWPTASTALTSRDRYFKAEKCYNELLKNPAGQKYRKNWIRCIEKFQAVYRHAPRGSWAAAGMYMSGVLYGKLYAHSHHKPDKKEALDIFERVIKRFPTSKYKARAAGAIRSYHKKASFDPPSKDPPEDGIKKLIQAAAKPKKPSKQADPPSATSTATITGLRFWSNPHYTRIVVDAAKETPYTHRLLKKDPAIKVPHQRLYIDFENSRLAHDIKKFIPIHDDLLRDVRAGQYTKKSVRVVIDLKSFQSYKIFALKNPFRTVIDVWGQKSAEELKTVAPAIAKKTPMPGKKGPAAQRPAPKIIEPKGKIPKGALARQLVLGVSRIVIDAGHGGRDYGAPGYLKGVHEKHVVLSIAKRLEKKIRTQLKCKVIMTRKRDRYLTLEERTAIANTKNADLFISIHTNAHRNRRAYGIETYFLNLATDEESIRVAARENATSTKNISDLQSILSDLMQNAKVNESSRLATRIQESVYKQLKRKYSRIRNKGVKQAPFYVLLGAQMPAVLVEASFISNAR